jgi:hypothetical protein
MKSLRPFLLGSPKELSVNLRSVITVSLMGLFGSGVGGADDLGSSLNHALGAASKTSTGFVLGTVGIGAGLRDPGVVDITIF